MGDRPLGVTSIGGGAHRRTAPRRDVEELLLLSGRLFELREGALATARARAARVLEGSPGALLDPDAVMNGMIASGLAGETDYWRAHCVPTGQRLAAELCGGTPDRAPDVRALPPRRFEVAFRRTFDLSRGPARRLRMPAPVEDAHLSDLEIEAETLRVEPGRLEAKPGSSERGDFVLSARFTFLAHAGVPHSRTGDGRLELPETWLAEREGPVQVTAEVVALAARLAAPWREPIEQVMAFRNHLIDTMACGRIALDGLGDAPPTDWILAHRWFDCRLGAALLVAMCRARGLPARVVGGYLLWQAPSEHYWMEVWLPDQGWTPFDLLAWDLSAGGRDPAWRDVYAGAVDYRMKTQVFPQIFTGAPGVPMGDAWHRLSRLTPGGTETRLVSIPGGELIYADTIEVVRG
jgi:hypothetical protein